jgi:ketosteroid isomerase-like protein
MIKSIRVLGLLFVGSMLLGSCGTNKADEQTPAVPAASDDKKMKTEQALRAANDQFYAALNAMFIGDLQPLQDIWSHAGDVTIMDPFGGRLTGWEAVDGEFTKVAAMKLGGKIVFKDLHLYAGSDLGYTIGVEDGENMGADGKPVMINHRATNIFRMENGQWKLVHHHTDLSPQLEKATATEAK